MKARFYGTLQVTQLDAERWELDAPLSYWSAVARRMVYVPTGFITDFASVPRLPFAYLLAGGKAAAAAVVHDFLYSTHEVDRATADAIFREAVGVLGHGWFTRQLMWLGVRVGGWVGWPKETNLAQPNLSDAHQAQLWGEDA